MKLYSYQEEALKKIKDKKNFALFFEMRLGKSIIILEYLKRIPQKNKKILISAPGSALMSWEDNIKYFFPEIKYKNISNIPTSSKRNKVLNFLSLKKEIIILTNKESFFGCGQKLIDFNFDFIILDESTFIKNPKAKVTKFYLRNFRETNKIILTGNPNPEEDLNYFCQLKFLDSACFYKLNYWEFRFKHCDKNFFKYELNKSGENILKSEIKRLSLTLSRQEAGIKNKKIFEKRLIELDKESQGIYNKIKDEYIYKNIDTKYSIVALGYQRQLLAINKIKEVKELISGELKNNKILIWTNFIEENKNYVDNIPGCKSITGETKNRKEILDQFNSGKIKYLAMQIKCGLFGLKIKTDTVIYSSLPFSLEDKIQSEDRTFFPDGNCLYIYLLYRNTLDTEIFNKLANKKILNKKLAFTKN